MKQLFLMTFWLVLLPVSGLGQKSISDLSTAHAKALQGYLTKQSKLKFLSEKSYDQDYLKVMREDFGANFQPFYQRGDFNGDGHQDFAVILGKNGPPKRLPDLAESHQLQYQVVILIFNGSNNRTFKMAFSITTTAPLVCFINTTREKKKRLYFGVYETDEGFTMTPRGGGYRTEYLN